MKKIIFAASIGLGILTTSFVLSKSNSVVVDNYKVIKVDGKITYVKTGKNLITGDLFASNEKITFGTKESRAAVISKLKGRFVLTPDSKGGKAANLLPAMSNVSTRAGALISNIDLKNHFSENYLLLDALELEIKKELYPMNDNNFFYLQYTLDGENIAKKLSFKDGNILELTAKEIYTIDGREVAIPESMPMVIYYRNHSEKKSTKISSFNLVTPNTENLKQELQVITAEVKDKSKENLKNEITAYLYEFYGKPQKANVSEWLETNEVL